MKPTMADLKADLANPTTVLAWAKETGDIAVVEPRNTCGCLLYHFFDRKYPNSIVVIDTRAVVVGEAAAVLDRTPGPTIRVDEGGWGQNLVERHWAAVYQDRLIASCDYEASWEEAVAVLEEVVAEAAATV